MRDDRGWPSVADYAARATEQGCTTTVTDVTRAGQPLQALRIEAPSGAHAMEIFSEWSDLLATTTIARLDRQLGMKTFFFV
jgi:hypothetical protein